MQKKTKKTLRTVTEPCTYMAVFRVVGSDGWRDYGKDIVTCYMYYVALRNNLSQGAALPFITREVEKRHPRSMVHFEFWADTYSATGRSPEWFTLELDGTVTVG